MSTPVTPENVLDLGLGFWGSTMLLSAIQLGVFTTLAQGVLDGEALRRELGLHEHSADDFPDARRVRHLVGQDKPQG